MEDEALRIGELVQSEGRFIRDIFFFKQKTAYEIYQCDWSSDVCSSDLIDQIKSLEAKNKDLVEAIEEILELDGTAPDFDKSCKLIATMAVRRNK